MDNEIETGSCFCGGIRAEFIGKPFWTCYDHDDDCRKAIGGPMNLWIGFRPTQVDYRSGTPKVFSKTPGIRRTFCEECGTSIGYIDEGLSDEVYVTIGFLDRPERFWPQAHAYWSMKLPWIDIADDLPKIEKVSRPRSADYGNPADRKPK